MLYAEWTVVQGVLHPCTATKHNYDDFHYKLTITEVYCVVLPPWLQQAHAQKHGKVQTTFLLIRNIYLEYVCPDCS